MAKGLNDKQLQALLREPPSRRTDLPDGTVDGLSLRVGPRGKPTWAYRFRWRGAGGVTSRGTALNGARYHRVSLGQYPAVSIKTARQKASDLVALMERGGDPLEKLEAAAVDRRDTVQALIDDYVSFARNNMRSWRNAKWVLNRHLAASWGDRPAGTITPREAQRLIAGIHNGTAGSATAENKSRPGAAAEARKWAAMLFEWARKNHRVKVNPFSDVSAPRLQPRQRFLSMDEARAAWRAAGDLASPWGEAIRLLMLTACRENEVCGAKWSWIDQAARTLTIPAEHYKSGRLFMVPLSGPAWDVIAGMTTGATGDFVFSTTGGEKPVAGIHRKVLDRLHVSSEATIGRNIERFRLHDLRRTVRTHLSGLRVNQVVAELVLGHAIKGIEATYNIYDFAVEKREALDIWANELTAETATASSLPV